MAKKLARKESVSSAQIDLDKLYQGQTLYHRFELDSRGYPVKAKIASIKRWKRNPKRFQIGMKHGIYNFFTIESESDLLSWGLFTIPMIDGSAISEELKGMTE